MIAWVAGSATIADDSRAIAREFTDMKLNRKSAASLVLVKGQIWKLQDSHIEILEMGKRLASYKHFRTLDNRRAPTQLANIQSVQEMLTTHKAVLLDTKAGSAAIKKITKSATAKPTTSKTAKKK